MNKYTNVLKANNAVFIHFLAVTCKSRSLLEPLRRVRACAHFWVLPSAPFCLMLFLANSARAPIPKPTARPGANTQKDQCIFIINTHRIYNTFLRTVCNVNLYLMMLCCFLIDEKNKTKLTSTLTVKHRIMQHMYKKKNILLVNEGMDRLLL